MPLLGWRGDRLVRRHDGGVTIDGSGSWCPALPKDVAELFGSVSFPWWVAGGFAIELAVGMHVREHGDLDVVVLRCDQLALRRALTGWDLHMADPPGSGRFRPWPPGDRVPQLVHDVWCRTAPTAAWSVQVMLDEADAGDWVSRRDSRVRRPLRDLGAVSEDGIPYLSPAVQLFYKAKNTRPKDEIDFDAALPLLELGERRWLSRALELTTPGHHWQARLK